MIGVEKKDTTKIIGHVRAVVRDARTNDVLRVIRTQNLVVNAGLDLIGDMLIESTAVGLNFFAVGTDNTGPAAGDTTLGAEVYRAAITTAVRTSPGVITITMFVPTTAANGSSLVEIGLFTLSSAGTMFSRAIHSSITKTASVTVTYQWTITFSAS